MRKRQKCSRLLALLLTVAMLLSLGLTAFAAEEPDAEQTSGEQLESTVPVPEASAEDPQEDEQEDPPEEPQENGQPEDEEQEDDFDPAQPFTLADISLFDMTMETAEIPVKYFSLEGKNEGKDNPCKLHFADPAPETLRGGLIAASVPATAVNEQGEVHAFSHAHVGDTEVFYMGRLFIHGKDGESGAEYIYYTTDTEIRNKTVYAVLKKDETISLVYDHGEYAKVTYQFQDRNGNKLEKGPTEQTRGGAKEWDLDQVFGADRAQAIQRGHELGVTVALPRGYMGRVVVTDATSGQVVKTGKELGRMLSYWQPNKTPDGKSGLNKIALRTDSPASMMLTDSLSVDGITGDMVVTVQYEPVGLLHFNARMWTTTDYAKDRIQIKKADNTYEAASDKNSILTIDGHSVTWEFAGITSGSGQARYTWEMNQLEINGEPIQIPMTSLGDMTPKSITTTLSTGTVVTLTVRSLGGTGGKDGQRDYTLQIENCYEDLTISGGNMVGHIHREYAINTIFGIADPQYWPNGGEKWGVLKQHALIDRRNGTKEDSTLYSTEPYVTAPFRFKIAEGYENLHVAFTTKDKMVLQIDDKVGTIYQPAEDPFIDYLLRTDASVDTEKGSYKTVAYREWKPSADGYYYCRANKKLGDFMKEKETEKDQGVILLYFWTDPKKSAIDYRSGAGDGTTAPLAENVDKLPAYQNGGENGYNITNNATALVNNQPPLDKSGKFTFDHWEILTVDPETQLPTETAKTDEHGQTLKFVPGEDIHVTEDMVHRLSDCLYYNQEQERTTLTLRAVWRASGAKTPIPYIVHYILADLDEQGKLLADTAKTIKTRTHTVNEGAMLVTDLYQWNETKQKVLSDSIQKVLEGNNDQRKDYTREANWRIYEPETTMLIESVTLEQNVANIWLVRTPVTVTVDKVWTGDETANTRPGSIQVQLYKTAPGEETAVGDPVALTKEGDWSHRFTGLAELEDGKPVAYTVKERTQLDGYTMTSKQTGNHVTITNAYQGGGTDTTPTPTGGLEVRKVVSGTAGETDRAFRFTVTLNDQTVTGAYGAMDFVNGVAEFELKHGEHRTATGLPDGVTYAVTESGNEGYTVASENAAGTIQEGETAQVIFTNHKDAAPPTNPGGGGGGGSQRPVDPAPIDPIAPIDPSAPEEPGTPPAVDPERPIQPDAATDLIDPSVPTGTADPSEPGQSAGAAQPEGPGLPQTGQPWLLVGLLLAGGAALLAGGLLDQRRRHGRREG